MAIVALVYVADVGKAASSRYLINGQAMRKLFLQGLKPSFSSPHRGG